MNVVGFNERVHILCMPGEFDLSSVFVLGKVYHRVALGINNFR